MQLERQALLEQQVQQEPQVRLVQLELQVLLVLQQAQQELG